MTIMRRSMSFGVVAGLLTGAAVGFAVARWLEPAGARRSDDARGVVFTARRTDAAIEPRTSPVEGADPIPGASREGVALAASRDELPHGDDEELASLRARLAELEAEVARLRALFAANCPAALRVRELVDANELRFGSLFREIAEYAVGDPEGIAENPRRFCELLLRAIDVTGLAAAPVVQGHREIRPESAAPDVAFSLDGVSDLTTVSIEGEEAVYRHDQATLRAMIILPKAPEEWLGRPLGLSIEWTVDETENGTAWMQLSIRDASSSSQNLFTNVDWNSIWERDGSSLSRSPLRGGDEDLQGGVDGFPAQRRMVDELTRRLRAVAR
jgi:hypothetical protein